MPADRGSDGPSSQDCRGQLHPARVLVQVASRTPVTTSFPVSRDGPLKDAYIDHRTRRVGAGGEASTRRRRQRRGTGGDAGRDDIIASRPIATQQTQLVTTMELPSDRSGPLYPPGAIPSRRARAPQVATSRLTGRPPA